MKKYLLVFITLIIAGCENFLNVEPREEISITEQFSTLEGVKQALNGAYYKTEIILSDKFFLYADILGGNITFAPTRTGSRQGEVNKLLNFGNIYDFNDLALFSQFLGFYESSYTIINNVNNIIFYIDNLSEGTPEQKQQIKSEALAIKAFVHFNLLQIYSQTFNFSSNGSHLGIVYADKILTGGVDFPARKSCAESYDLIIRDLQESLALMTANQSLQGPKYSFFNPISTKALLAKVALQKNDWNLALSTANDVLNSSNVTLMSNLNYLSEWSKPLLPVSEILLEFSAPLTPEGSMVSSSVSKDFKIIFNSSGAILDYGLCVASRDLLNLYDNNDVRKANFIVAAIPTKTNGVLTPIDYYFTKKHQDLPGTISIRLSEMYLIIAEANARLNKPTEALTALNIIKNRAGIASLNNSNNLLDEIFLERRRELCFEGSLFFDCARFNKSVSRNLGCISLLCNLNYPNNRFVLPIPQQTLSVNQNLIQNEGY